MTVNDLLKRIPKEDYNKVIVISDGEGWTNISGNVEIGENIITLYDENIYPPVEGRE